MSIRGDEVVGGQLNADKHVVVAVDHAKHASCATSIESQNAGHDIVAPVAANEVTVRVVSVPIAPEAYVVLTLKHQEGARMGLPEHHDLCDEIA